MKLAISAGPVTFALIGTKTTSHYVVVGNPIWDVKAAEHISSPGDIIVAQAGWHYINPTEYLFTDMPDGIHVKITGIGANWRSVQKNVRHQHLDASRDDMSSSTGSSETDDLNEPEGVPPMDEFSCRSLILPN